MSTNPSTDLLLITCASGRQATALLPRLKEWKHLRLAVHSQNSVERLSKQYPSAEVIQTNLYSPSNCASLLQDVTVVLHIGPSYHQHESSIGEMMIDAAVETYDNGTGPLKHFILSSVLGSQLSKMMNHDCKRKVEEYLMESNLPYTILQPTTFMDNLPIAMFAQSQDPTLKYASAWSITNKFSWINLYDLSAVMVKVIQERDKHFYAQYSLVSTHSPVSFSEALGTIAKKLGKDLDISRREYRDGVDFVMTRVGREGPRIRDAAQRMVLYYDNRGLVGNSNVLEWLLGREATQFEEWVELKLKEVQGSS